MAKYISQEMYKSYKVLIPNLVKRKTTLVDLWNAIYDYVLDDAEMKIGPKLSTLEFVIKNKKYSCNKPSSEIYVVSSSGDVKKENYNILIEDALQYMLSKKLLKKSMVSKLKKHTEE